METPLGGRARQVRALFAKFDRVGNPLISEFTSSIPERFGDAASLVAASNRKVTNELVLQNRIALKDFVRKFHAQAGTLTGAVENSISLLYNPYTQLLVSTHQPNLFAYGGVFKKIVLLETLKNVVERQHNDNNIKIVNLFLIIDHDFLDESWVRLAQLPSMRHSSGVLELRMPVNEQKRWQMVCNVPLPAHAVVDSWKRQVKSWIKGSPAINSIDNKKYLIGNLEQLWNEVEESYLKAKSYADLNSFLMSRVVNLAWGYSTLFVRLSEISAVFAEGFSYLISNFDIYSDTLRQVESTFLSRGIDTGVSPASHLNAPVWLHCRCGSKATARITKNRDKVVLAGPCMSCKKELELNLDNLTIDKAVHNLSPRAIPIPLLLSRDLGVSCYASGTGGIGYLVDGSVVSKKLKIQLPMIFVWASRDVYRGIGQAEALATMESMQIENIDLYLHELARQHADYKEKIKPLLFERAEKVRSGKGIDEELLSRLFALKEQQRQIRQQIKIAEKIQNAVSLSPCLIDYAVNFGIAMTEKKWRSHLLEKGDLAAPVVF